MAFQLGGALRERALANVTEHVFRAAFGCDGEAGREIMRTVVVGGCSEANRFTVEGVIVTVGFAPTTVPRDGWAVEVAHFGGINLSLPLIISIVGVTAAGLDGL